MESVDLGKRGDERVGGSSARLAAAPRRSLKAAETGRGDAMDADAVAATRATGAVHAEIHPSLPGPALRFDWINWLPYLEDQDIPEEQKRELIETLWSVVVSFVDLGWQLNPRPEFCGEALDLKAILTAADEGSGKEAE